MLNLLPYRAEYAVQSIGCNKCQRPIDDNLIRIGIMQQVSVFFKLIHSPVSAYLNPKIQYFLFSRVHPMTAFSRYGITRIAFS